MSHKYNGDFNRKRIKGKGSKAAKKAFEDIMADPDNKNWIDTGVFESKEFKSILTEDRSFVEDLEEDDIEDV